MPEFIKRTVFVYSSLILSTLLVFWQIRNFDFLSYNDNEYVYENSHVFNGLIHEGAVFCQLGPYQDAIEPFKQAIRIKPDLAEAHCNLGAIFANIGRYQDAIESYKQTIKIKPDYVNAHSNLGIVYLATGDRNSAVEECKILKILDAKQAEELYKLINAK